MFESGDHTSFAPRPSPVPSSRMLWASRIWAKSSRSSPVPCTTTVVSFSRHFELLESMHVEARANPSREENESRGRRWPSGTPSARWTSHASTKPDSVFAKTRLRCPLAEPSTLGTSSLLDRPPNPYSMFRTRIRRASLLFSSPPWVVVSPRGTEPPRRIPGSRRQGRGPSSCPGCRLGSNEPSILGRLVPKGSPSPPDWERFAKGLGSGLSLKWYSMRRRGRRRVQVVEPDTVVRFIKPEKTRSSWPS